jgi:hypothetical protein
MIKLFIPSYNRPCQLHALLESLEKYDKNNIIDVAHVFYQGTTEALQLGYEKLIKNKEFDWVVFEPKSGNHYKDVMKSLEWDFDYWTVTTDDSVFYRDFSLNIDDLNKSFTDSVNHLSFRLGYNTTTIDYSNPDEKHYLTSTTGSKLSNEHGLVQFYWPRHVGHYGHPFALDSFLTKTGYMRQLMIQGCSPAGFDYRYMECKLGDYLRMNQNKPLALCFEQSVLVNIPSNKVCSGPYLKNGVIHPYTTEELNQRYLDGEKIDIVAIGKNNIDNVQMELPFNFIQQ